MDIASTVYTITSGIIDFVAEHGAKDSLQEQISDIVLQIRNVVGPLIIRDVDNIPLQQTLQGMQNVLSNVDSHLRSWKESRSRRMLALVNPWAVTQEIKEDRVQLMHQYILLMGAMQVVNHIFVRGYNYLPPPPQSAAPLTPQSLRIQQLHLPAAEEEVLQFWHSRIGGDFEVVKSQDLCNHLASWLNIKLGPLSRRRLLLRLDEHNTGHVTLKTLQDLVQNTKMKDTIKLYTSNPKFPLLIWISDDLALNAPKVAFALEKGVSVVQLATTATAKAWINANRNFLLKHDNAGEIRFISDQFRKELNAKGEAVPNRNAGNQIIKFIRDKGFQAPILIYTNKKSLHLTRYVESYPNAGSAAGHPEVYQEYISALGSRRVDDREWMKFGA
ncbi:hypothetical protein JR316_0007454 [Psilocybe cubensis]|uniref:Uncharacterized protein n=2 Tax=Psilocybe cubensis TaxID=181762 RepID=A0ACB8GZQ2_PSICU|nr:hypothetical protein JR316_0007454 [Psilocybe cubensis]KAH9480852.1 hypothetical protein JR316_0007454 [Psilocybe cubensis]